MDIQLTKPQQIIRTFSIVFFLVMLLIGTKAIINGNLKGNPFVETQIIGNHYAPHAFDVVYWSVAFFMIFLPKYNWKAIFFFGFAYGASETIYNSIYIVFWSDKTNLFLYNALTFGLITIFCILIIGPKLKQPKYKIMWLMPISYICFYGWLISTGFHTNITGEVNTINMITAIFSPIYIATFTFFFKQSEKID